MNPRVRKVGMWTLAGTMLAGPVAAACSSGPTYDQWAATDGAAGRINLDEVQAAFKSSKSVSQFEERVNQIYEGDGLVFIRAVQEPEGLVVEGWEDLNGNLEIDDTADDRLFAIFERDKQHQIQGYGANGYYNRGFGAGDFLLTYMLFSAISPRGYSARPTPGTTLKSGRDSYRNTSRYRSQVSNNSRYFSQQKSFAGSRYDQSARNQSTARRSYQSRQQSSGAFKKSATGVRSTWGRSSARSIGGRSSRGGGFFRGGGGAQRIIGINRHEPLG